MADRRRRSPESSNRRENHYYNEPPRTRYSAESLSSSSSSSSYLDISRTFPTRAGLRAFFTAPSERRRLRKRRSKGLLRLGNSSSSSVNSDLAYGTGFIKKPKRRGVRSRKGKEIDRESHRGYARDGYKDYAKESTSYTQETNRDIRERDRERPGNERRSTDAEILAVGAGLAKLARDQNKRDLKAGKIYRGAEAFVEEPSSYRNSGTSKGLGPSKASHGKDSSDDDGWESASDGESDSSVDSKLAFGEDTGGGWFSWGKEQQKPQSRKSTIVDPRLFGRQNSLNGIITEPVGYGATIWAPSNNFGQNGQGPVRPENYANSQVSYFDQRNIPSTAPQQNVAGSSYTPYYTQQTPTRAVPPESSASSSRPPPMQHVYPVPTEDPSRFEVARGSVASGAEPYVSSRPVAIQQPQPITPVSQSVYEPTYSARADGGILKRTPSSSGRGQSLAEAAIMGVAGAAIGAAIISDRKDDRKDDRKEKRRDDRDTSSRISSRSYDKEDRRHERRREKEKSKDSDDEKRGDKKREKRRDDGREETKEERRERRREERRSERSDVTYESRRLKSDVSVFSAPVDPFQYQVADDAFSTPVIPSTPNNGRITAAPTVVTVDREPDFSRDTGSSNKDRHVVLKSQPLRDDEWDSREQRYRQKDSDERALHNAEDTYRETQHSTAPIEAAAIGAAIAAVVAEDRRESRSDRRRDERRNGRRDYDDYDQGSSKKSDKSTDRDREHDKIQEEADRAYREIIMARKIASQVIRSRSPSPDPSVVNKYDHQQEEEEIIRIITPPGMEDHKKKGPYDAPNADFQLDYVLEHPRDLQTFSVPSTSREAPYLKRDPDAILPRPHLNLVRPTPVPTPVPEKQAAREEKKPTRSDSDKPSKPNGQEKRVAASEIAIDSKGNVVAVSSPPTSTPTSSTVSKGVTWGQNETKHYVVESPTEHRDEFVSSSDIRTREQPVDAAVETRKASERPSSGWGAVAAAVTGASFGAAIANSSDTSKKSKSKEGKKAQQESGSDAPYEYRGIVVEPESPSRSKGQSSPPPPGPKPSSPKPSHIPGAFDDEFAATVAAGLQDSGFDPNIVIDDPSFRRRQSPPGSDSGKLYRAPFAETVSDLGTIPLNPASSDASGFVIGEAPETPKDWESISVDNEKTTKEPKLSKKEQRKREKAARTQSDDIFATPLEEPTSYIVEESKEPESYFETPKLSKKEQKKRDKAAQRASQFEDETPLSEPSVAQELVEEPESYFETPKKSKKKSKKSSSTFDYETEETPLDKEKISVPVDAFADIANGEDEWAETKKSKKKSKRDSDRFDSPNQSVVSEFTPGKKSKRDSGRFDSPARSVVSEPGPELERSSSKKSKDKSRRRSEHFEPEVDPAEVSLPPITPSEIYQDVEFDDSRKSRKSSRKDSGDRDESRSVVSESATKYFDDDYKKSKKKSRSSTRDDFDDTRSVASAPAGDDFDDKKSKKKDKRLSGGLWSLFGSKSESGAREETPKASKDDFEDVKRKKKSKRNSMPDSLDLYGVEGSQSVGDLSRISSNGNGNHYEDDDGGGGDKGKSRSRAESTSSKKDSFLANAGTLGAGVGLAGAAVAIAQHHQRSNASIVDSKESSKDISSDDSLPLAQHYDIIDPEITQREIRPSIDPQYGDLLPLPPSDPASPDPEPVDGLPELPESRPDTPETDRVARERVISSVRKNIQEAPVKSPSQSAVPLKFFMGNRSNPASPSLVRASPSQSPATPTQESLGFPRFAKARPKSWDSTKEFKPLYLVESNRRSSVIQANEEEVFPSLPSSQSTSRSSSELGVDDNPTERYGLPEIDLQKEGIDDSLAIDTSEPYDDMYGSQQSTPKAKVLCDNKLPIIPNQEAISESHYATPASRPASPQLPELKPEHADTAAEALGGATSASTIGYFASSPTHQTTKQAWLEDLPSASAIPRQPSPIEPMSKDRSSYLLQSSPLPSNFEEHDYDLESPLAHKVSAFSEDVGLRHIEERDGNDIFDEALSRELKDDHGLSRSVADTQELPGTNTELVESQPIDTSDLVDEFSLLKTKKDKKNDKKKAKRLSRSVTLDDIPSVQGDSIIESIQDDILPAPTQEGALAYETGPVEEFSSKSKKDKKKDKNKGKELSSASTSEDVSSFAESTQIPGDRDAASVIGEDEPLSRSVGEDYLTTTKEQSFPKEAELPDIDQTLEEFAVTKSKKDKKKEKKKAKGLSRTSTTDDISLSELVPAVSGDVIQAADPGLTENVPHSNAEETAAPETSNDETRAIDISGDIDPVDEFSLRKSKKEKKKDKKKNKSAMSWEPEPEEPTTDLLLTSGDVIDDTQAAEPDDAPGDFSFTQSKKDKKNKKKGGVEIVQPPIFEDTIVQPIEQTTAEEIVRDTLEDIRPSVEADLAEDLSFAKSKKDKKKDKKKRRSSSSWDPPEDQAIAASLEPPQDLQNLVKDSSITEEPWEQETQGKKRKDKKEKSIAASSFEDSNAKSPTDYGQDLSQETINSIQSTVPAETAVDVTGAKDVKQIGLPTETQGSVGEDSIFDTLLTKRESSSTSLPMWAAEGEINTDEIPAVIPAVTAPVEEWDTPLTKKSKKKKKSKAEVPWEMEDQTLPPDTTQLMVDESEAEKASQKLTKVGDPTPIRDIASERLSESSEAVEGVQTPAFESAVETPTEIEAAAPYLPSTKSKKKSKKSQKWDPSLTAEEIQDTLSGRDEPKPSGSQTLGEDNFLVDPKATPPNDASTPEYAQALISTQDVSILPEPSTSAPESSLATPATPWATSLEEQPLDPSNTEYFPSVTGLHSAVDQVPKDLSTTPTPTRGYFPSAATLLSFVGMGKKSEPEQVVTPSSPSQSQQVHETQEPLDSRAPIAETSTPDGLKAGYDNDQLSLARQLQQEFGKKSKKDKKKRQSLPSTPDSEVPRSRARELADTHLRSRSLSVDPSPALESPRDDNSNEQRKNVYSEDQLELARQLKAEFEGGNKKSKRDKKKRQSIAPEIPWDQPSADQPTDSVVEAVTADDAHRADDIEDSAKRDGFEAGYQEDQLSLARQLQAEFASGSSKKSKKDKKRRSTSQTPIRETESQNDFFGTPDEPATIEPLSEEVTNVAGLPAEEKPLVHDGFAAGYKEDQLELARQLKEEFGSGSKKSKKDKKRQSLSRGISSSDHASPPEPVTLDDVESGVQTPDTAPNDLVAEPEDEFPTVVKKSKKDKKGKKRQSLAWEDAADAPPEATTPNSGDKEIIDISTADRQVVGEDPIPEEEFSLKKSKKEKKAKKRQNLPHADTDEIVAAGMAVGGSEILHKLDNMNSSVEHSRSDHDVDHAISAETAGDQSEQVQEVPKSLTDNTESSKEEVKSDALDAEPIPDIVDEWAMPSKKSKKDKKKKRDSSVQPPTANPVPEQQLLEEPLVEEPATDMPNHSAQPSLPTLDDEKDQSEFTSKKLKKDKKKKKAVEMSLSEEAPQLSEPTEGAASTTAPLEAEIPSTPAVEAQEDEFAFTTKKSKKDKKKQKNLESSPAAEVPQGSESIEERLSQDTSFQAEIPVTPAIDAQEDEFEFATKKSKKDKKNRKNNQPIAEAATVLGSPSVEPSLEDVVDDISVPVADDNADVFEVTTKKSKKDKKKSKSLQSSSPKDETPATAEESIESTFQDVIDETPNPAPTKPQDISFESTSKNSETGKENICEGIQLSVPETLSPQLDISLTAEPQVKGPEATLDNSYIPDPAPQQDAPIVLPTNESVGVSEEVFADNVSLSKNSEKDQKGQEKSGFSGLDEESRQSTPPELISEPIIVQPSLTTGDVPEKPVDATEIATDVPDSLPARDIPKADKEQPDEEWGNFSMKTSKKDRKKHKSGISTPTKPEVKKPVSEDATLSAEASTMPAETAKEALEQVEDEWGSPFAKKSKKEKKKANPGLSTPLESTTLSDEPPQDELVADDTLAPGPSPERSVQQPEEEWSSLPSKKSKKDKKKSKSGRSTQLETANPLEETPKEEAIAGEPSVTESIAEQPEDEWGSFGSKKSKKDKKARSGISTPAEPSTLEQGTLRGTPMSDEAPAVEALEEIHIEQPEDQGSSFNSKKSKKDKKKGRSGLSTQLEQEISITSPLIEEVHSEQPIIEKEAEQPEDDWAATVSSKKSKKDKGKVNFGLSTPLEQEEAEDKSLTELTPAMQLAPGQEIEQLEDDWVAPATSKKSKKDKKKGKNSDFKVSEETEDIAVLGTTQIVEHEEAPADDPVPKENDTEQPEDEWSSFSTKKSKKDKKNRKSGNSTPLVVEAPQTPDDKLSEEPAQLIIEEPQPDESLSRQSEVPKPEDEWGTFSAKKSKKDKKNRKSGISTPVEETDPVSEQVASVEKEETTQPPPKTAPPQQNEPQQPEDEWGAFPVKKSKKDQTNRKSGILTPAEERIDAAGQVASVAEEEVNEPGIISSTREAPSQSPKLPQPQEEEWAGKKSKKDKKNRKSGISTPLEESVPAAEKEEAVDTSAHPPPPLPEGVREQIDSQQPDDEWGSFSVKKSKKDKKKHKSGIITPIEDCVAISEVVSAEKEATTEPNTSPQPDEPVPSQDEPQEPEDWASFSVKKSKKEKRDKKNRKSGPPTPMETDIASILTQATVKEETAVHTIEDTSNQAVSNSQTAQELSEGAGGMQETNDNFFVPTTKSSKKVKKNQKSGLSMPLEEATIIETKTSNSREITTDPVTVSEAKQTIVSSNQVDEASADTQQPEIPSASHEEHEAYLETSTIGEPSVELARSSSKDKRKRQVTIDTVMSEEPSSSSIPALTSWADEVEEAEVERELPVIDEIANDESLSHIASTTATDDFTRPTKKGKKGKKKDSAQASSLRSPVTVTPKKDSGEPSIKPAVVAAAAAALVSAAITASRNVENSSTPEEAAKPPVSKKLSKKEKRKKSIDRRTPQDDDIFDDPVLWEGAKPAALQETKGTEDEPEQDDFWSPQRGEPAVDHEESPALQNRDIQTEHLPVDETMSIDPNSNVVSAPQQSENVQVTKEQSPPDIFHAKDISRDSDERNLIAGLEQHHAKLPELASYRSLGERDYYDPSEALIAEELNQVKASLYGRPGSRAGSVLPVVREESPVQEEAEPTTRKLSPPPHSVDFNRDSAFITESPIPLQKGFTDQHEHIRDSGVHLRDFSPADKSREPVSTSDDALARMSWPAVDEESETVDLHKSQRQKTKSSMEPREFDSHASPRSNEKRLHSSLEKSPAVELRKSPLSKSRTISPQNNEARNSYKSERHSHDPSSDLNLLQSQKLAAKDDKPVELHRTQTIHRSATPKGESLVQQWVKRIESPDIQRSQKPKEDKYKELSTPQRPPPAERPSSFNESSIAAGAILGGAALGFAAARQSSREQRPGSVGSNRSSPNINRLRTPDLRPESVISNRSTGTPPLRRSDRKSGDLRSLSQHSSPNLAKEAELAAINAAQVNVANPTANEGRVRAKDMADVYDGFGEGRMGSPRSPTRPHSMRRRQSMQVLDLESKLEQLAADNRMLTEAKAQAEHALQSTQHASSTLVERDAEIDTLKRTLDWLQKEVTRLSEVNDGLTSANITLGNQHNDRYGQLEAQHTQATRELQELRATHENLSSGMEGIVRNEVQGLMEGKDQEIERLRAELDAAKEQIRTMQRQILASKPDNLAFLTIRDEDYFDTACQQLCQHVQQWVLRFSKFSDMRACRLTKEINNDKIIDRLDNAILDGSDVDNYLADRVKRRDVFMSMTMTMIWEYVFTRYLFGMDREQRQKLKSLEKILLEVGPASAVHQWRATTLTLLSKRKAFIEQREQDTLAVVNVVMETLTEILPPPSHLEEQIQEQLIRVMKAAVELSIEMRTQRAEYMMLPPLQPEYDANGDLASKVSFNAALMNERSGESVSNEALEEQSATVRIVLFPLVVKKGDDNGAGDEEIVVCPAQVLVARPKKTVRLFTPESLQNHSRVSMQSSMPADHGDNLI